jgi:hypothetical protein
MSLSDLYRCHVEMCFQMAAASKHVEVRQQWTKLGERWRQKAEADEHNSPREVTPNLAVAVVPELAPLQPKLKVTPNLAKGRSSLEIAQQKLEPAPSSAPTVILNGASLEQKAKRAPLDSGGLSDIWARIASPINLGD